MQWLSVLRFMITNREREAMNIDTRKIELVRYRMTVGAFNTVNATKRHDGMWVQYENAKDVESALSDSRRREIALEERCKAMRDLLVIWQDYHVAVHAKESVFVAWKKKHGIGEEEIAEDWIRAKRDQLLKETEAKP